MSYDLMKETKKELDRITEDYSTIMLLAVVKHFVERLEKLHGYKFGDNHV